MDINSVNPYIRVAMRSVLKPGFTIKQRVIFDYELIYIDKGHFTFRYAGIPYRCGEGQFIFIRPSVPHSFEDINENLFQPHVHFDIAYNRNSSKTSVSFKDIPQMSAEERELIQEDVFAEFPKTPFVSFSDTEKARAQLFAVIDLYVANKQLSAKGVLTELLDALISDNFPSTLSKDDKSFHDISRQIKDFIDSSQGLDLGLDALSKQFSYSKYYLERQFKQKYGVSLIAYRNDKRMSFACQMLERDTVSSVSEKLGFSSIYSFSRTFKNKYGISPSKYKKDNFSKNN